MTKKSFLKTLLGITGLATWVKAKEPEIIQLGSDDISLKIEWKGWPVLAEKYRGIDPGFYGSNPPPSEFVLRNIEIGFREDGIVCWREIK